MMSWSPKSINQPNKPAVEIADHGVDSWISPMTIWIASIWKACFSTDFCVPPTWPRNVFVACFLQKFKSLERLRFVKSNTIWIWIIVLLFLAMRCFSAATTPHAFWTRIVARCSRRITTPKAHNFSSPLGLQWLLTALLQHTQLAAFGQILLTNEGGEGRRFILITVDCWLNISNQVLLTLPTIQQRFGGITSNWESSIQKLNLSTDLSPSVNWPS